MENIFYLNGQFLPEKETVISVNDLGLLRGFGIFDFFRSVNGKVLFLEDHLDRFEFSAEKLQLEIPYSRVQLREIIHETIKLNPAPLLGIKMILTGGYSSDGYTPTTPNMAVLAKPFTFMNKPEGMHLMTLDYLRELPEIKTLSYIVPIMNRPKMIEMGADDYLYHKNGFVSELSRSNLFLIKNGKLITPDTNILRGITRKHILKIVENRFDITIRPVTLEETLMADELFTSGSTKRVLGITKIDNKPIGDGKVGKLTTEIAVLFQKHEEASY